MPGEPMNRRSFLKTSAVAAGGAVLASAPARAAGVLGANDRIGIGIIGMGGRGTSWINPILQIAKQNLSNVELVAVADLWKEARERAVDRVEKAGGRKPQAFVRYQDLLEKGGVDAVVITTPDFWHIPILLDAVKAGKDAFVEKPLGVDLKEAKAARDAVRASGRVVQVGTQRRSQNIWYAARDFVASGQLGQISTAEAAFNDCSPRWTRPTECARTREADFDWKFYLRDREFRPFNPRHIHEWKLFRDFTMGTSGLLGCHLYDAFQLVMNFTLPKSAVAQGGVYVYKDGREVEDTFMALIEYPQEVVLHYTTRLGNASSPGCKIYGTYGTLDVEASTYSSAGSRAKKLPDKPTKIEAPRDEYGADVAHMKNLLDCMRTRETPRASIEHGYQHMVTAVMAQRAMIEGRRLRYDPEKEEIV